jgi:hypothetical protein
LDPVGFGNARHDVVGCDLDRGFEWVAERNTLPGGGRA